MIPFGFNSTNFKAYIHLPCIKTQRRKTAPFNETYIISYSDHPTIGIYPGSAYRCEGDRNFDIICLLQQYQEIHYCNQSVLAIVPDLNIFVFSITIFDLISRSALVRFSLLRASYWYKSMGLRFYICFGNQHSFFVVAIVTGQFTVLLLQKCGFKACTVSFCLY